MFHKITCRFVPRASLVCLIGSIVAANALATVYYVSPSGSDKKAGTSPALAWKTITRVNKGRYSPGDRILFQGSSSFSGTLTFTRGGTPSAPIVVSSYGSGRATVKSAGRALFAYNVAGFRIANINFSGGGRTSNTGEGIMFYNDLPNNTKLPYIDIQGVDVSGFGKDGICIGAWNGKSGYSDIRILNVDTHDNAVSGINIWGTSTTAPGWSHFTVYIAFTRAFNNSGISGYSRHTGDGIVVGDADVVVVERSVAFNNGWLSTTHDGPVGIWAYDVNRALIQYNESYGNRSAGAADGGGFDLDGGAQNSVMQYNYSHDNDGPGFLLCWYSGARPSMNNVLRYNVSHNDARKNGVGAIHLWGAQTNSAIYHNTVDVSKPVSGLPKALWVQSGVTNLSVRNNIFIARSGLTSIQVAGGQSNALFQNNSYWAAGSPIQMSWNSTLYSGLSAWRAATGQEKVNGIDAGFEVDPGLSGPALPVTLGDASLLSTLSAYRLNTTSPLVDRGLNLTGFGIASGPFDFYGNASTLGLAPDLGASEAGPY